MLKLPFCNVFARSPIKPMIEHMDIVASCAAELLPLADGMLKQNWDDVSKLHKKILKLESKADLLKKDIRVNLPTNLFLPVARSDLLGLLIQQEKLASRVKHIAGIIYSRHMCINNHNVEQDLLTLLKKSITAVSLAKKASHELEELIATGFKGQEIKNISTIISELESAERETDLLQVKITHKLFKVEKEYDPVDIIFLYQMLDWVADVADKAQNIGQCLESFLAQ